MPKPACAKCQRFYRPKKNGIRLIEGMPIGNGAPAGTAAPEQWKPYKVWIADLWECEGCGHQLVSGYARERLAEHYEGEKFAAAIASVDLLDFGRGLAPLQINDC